MLLPRFALNRDPLRHWPALLETALVLVLALQAAHLLWALLTPAGPLGPPAIHYLPARLPALASHDPFFGGTTAGATPSSTGLEGWRLFGLRHGQDSGSAILAKDKAAQAAYRPGDELAPGLVLESVAMDHVLVRDGGTTRRLDLSMPPDPSVASSPAAAQLASASPVQVKAAAADVDPGQLLAQSGLKVLDEGGRTVGYTLMPQGDGALLRKAGLQPGDVLLRVNSQPLGPGTLAEVAEELKQNPHATIEFRRDGHTHTVTLGSGTL